MLNVVGILWLLPFAFLLVPLIFSIRQLVRPVPEPAVSWPRAVLVPGIVGLILAGLAGLIFTAIGEMHCRGEWGCFGQFVLALITVPPGAAIVAALILRAVGTPRPWLTGIVGVIAAGLAVLGASLLVPLGSLLYLSAGVAGFVWAALVLGPLVPPIARIVVYCLIIVLIPVTKAVDSLQDDREELKNLESISVALMVPDVPGYHVTHAYADTRANRLSVYLHPTDAGYAQTITVEGIAVPYSFAPPDNCGPEFASTGGLGVPCTAVGDQLWRRERYNTVVFIRRQGDWLYLVQGGAPDAVLRQAAESLHQITAAELARLSN